MPLQLAPLRSVSPSSAEVLRLCPFRLHLGRLGVRGLTAPGPAARLGNASHDVLAKAADGRFAGLDGQEFDDAFTEAWDSAIAEQQARMNQTGEAGFGPLDRWPSYELTRARTCIACKAIAPPQSGEVSLVEQPMAACDGRLNGRPDRVLIGEHVTVEDFKTGAIYETVENDATAERRLKESYRRQVLLYAVLVAAHCGRWPDLARIIALSGEIEAFPVAPEEASLAADESLRLLDAYNTDLCNAPDPSAFATPGEIACGSCSYQATCEPHWHAASPSWGAYISLEGSILARQDSQAGFTALRVDVMRGTCEPGPVLITHIQRSRFPQVAALGPGQRVRLTKLRQLRGSLSPGWFTQLRLL